MSRSNSTSSHAASKIYAEAKLGPARPQHSRSVVRIADEGERIFDDGPAPRDLPATTTTTTTTSEIAPPALLPPALKLIADRRTLPRRQVEMGAMAVFATDAGAGLITRVMLRDMSWMGVGLTSPVEVARGSTVRLTPEHAMVPHQVGTVARCTPREDGEGFDIGVRVHTKPLAA